MMMMMTNGSDVYSPSPSPRKNTRQQKEGRARVGERRPDSLSAFTQAQAPTKTVQKVEISVSHELWCNSIVQIG